MSHFHHPSEITEALIVHAARLSTGLGALSAIFFATMTRILSGTRTHPTPHVANKRVRKFMYVDTRVGILRHRMRRATCVYIVMNRIETDAPERFEKSFGRSMTAALTGVPGLTAASLLRPESDNTAYISVMEFEDEQAFKNWMGSESFRRAHAGVREQEPTKSTVETYSTVLDMNP